MTPELFALVAERFKALAEPVRLEILGALRRGERTVGDLVEATVLNQANVFTHLQLLHGHRFVRRRKDGRFVYCALAAKGILQLCTIMCGPLDADLEARRTLLAV